MKNKEFCQNCQQAHQLAVTQPGLTVECKCPCHTLSTVEEANFVDSMTPEERKHQSELEKTAVYTSTAPTSKASWEIKLEELFDEFHDYPKNSLVEGAKILFRKQIEEAEVRGIKIGEMRKDTTIPDSAYDAGKEAGKSEALRLVREWREKQQHTEFCEKRDIKYRKCFACFIDELYFHLDTLQTNTKEHE